MNLELSLLELNDLYVASSRYVAQCAENLNEYGKNVSGINYFKNELDKAEALRDKIQIALHTECRKLDEAKEFVLNYIDEEIEYANNMNEAKWEDLKLGNL